MKLESLMGLVLGVVLLGGCVTTRLTPEAELIRVTANPEAVRGCESIGIVKGADRLQGGVLGGGAAEENAMRRMKNAAAKLGANTILLMSSRGTMGGGAANQGEAYKCPPATNP